MPIPASTCYTPCHIFFRRTYAQKYDGEKQATGLHENGSQVSNASESRCQVLRCCATTLPCRARAIVSSVQCSLVVLCSNLRVVYPHSMRGWPGARSVTSAAMGWQCVIYTPATRRHAAAGLPLHAPQCFGTGSQGFFSCHFVLNIRRSILYCLCTN